MYISKPLIGCMSTTGKSLEPFNGIKKYISTGAVNTDTIDFSSTEDVTYRNRPSRANLVTTEGDVIFAKMKDTQKTLLISSENVDYLYSTGFYAMTPIKEKITSEYLFSFTNSIYFLSQKDKNCTGATQKALNGSGLSKIRIPLPTLLDQKIIAEVLHKASELIMLRMQQLEKMDQLVKSQFIELFGDPKDNTKQWPVYNLDELCKVGSSKRLYQNEQTTEGIPFLRISDLMQRIETGNEDCNLFIPVERYKELKSQDLVPAVGDILVTSRGTLGACYIVKETDSFYFQDGMISWLYRIEKSILPFYISYLFATKGFRKQIDRLQAGSTVAYLSISMMKKLRIMLPPLDIQTQFVTFVQQVDKSKFVMNQSLERLEQCHNALMQKAFG